ncbi:MAG: class I SAM-dependent methyltransferase [Magnetococcales bacterium]|nr:class I SAM-dependent methyltransferase [Magnetococcales bacterium]
MKTEWDYTSLAKAYLKRPDYAPAAIDKMLERCGLGAGASVCDVGAGVAHLTLRLRERGLQVTAVEPNDAMRALGVERTRQWPEVKWFEGVGEATGQPDSAFDLVTFGSSFNVTDRPKAMLETCRILKPHGWFAVMWNHRDLSDPIQAEIEGIIQAAIPEYKYGARREDQSEIISKSNLFNPVVALEGRVVHQETVENVVEAWRSHGTLERQAGDRFDGIVKAIEKMLIGRGKSMIPIPYDTKLWMAQRR